MAQAADIVLIGKMAASAFGPTPATPGYPPSSGPLGPGLPQPPNYGGDGGSPTPVQESLYYTTWLGGIVSSLQSDTDPWSNQSWTDTARQLGIWLAVLRVDVSCLHNSSCKDTDLQKAEAQQLAAAQHRGDPTPLNVGRTIYGQFHGQSQAIRNQAATYLNQKYGVPGP